jgi:hypothetical protein
MAHAVYATDLKAVFLCNKVKSLRSAILTNEGRIRQLSTALEEERQASLDLVSRINEHKERLRREELDTVWFLREQENNESWRAGKPPSLRSTPRRSG